MQDSARTYSLTRQETPSLSIPTLSAAFRVRTFAASSVPPSRGAAVNSGTGRGTSLGVRQYAQSRMALAGRARLQSLVTTGIAAFGHDELEDK